jgi:iron complex outermembrane receptor protein
VIRRVVSTRFAALALAAFGMTPSGACAQEQQTGEGKPEVVIIQATRSGRALEDEPIRVDVVDQEEVSEKQVMTPGNIAMLVNETVGVRVQVTSPALGASNIRMQGMNGKYASLLADGLPLYGGQTSSLGLLQVPPTDLGQVEVIKGAASALYGPSALGGVINLVSRRPGEEVQGEVYANLTRRDGQDLTGYVATPINESLGVAMTGGYSRQSQVDIDRDGWADMPAYDRWTARPRMFWNGEGGASAFITAGAMREQRQGGTLPGRAVSDGRPFIQSQDTTRLDTGLVAEFPIENTGVLHLRGSAMRQDHDHRFGDVLEKDRHSTSFAEASLSGDRGRTSLLGGLAFQSDSYRSESFPTFNYTYDTPALFGQIEHKVFDDLVLAVSGRVDAHSEYGTFFSPRLSALYKPGDFTMRASLGRGFYAPTPFVEETEANGLSRLAPLSGLRAETANTSSIDLGYRFRGGWQANVTVFGSDIRNAVRLENTGGTTGPAVRLVNVAGVTATRGAELTARFRWREVTVNGSYVYVDATEPDTDGRGRREVPVTPKQAGGVDFMWERPGRSRLGFEAYYTGSQSLEDNPYRSRARPYLLLGLMGELSFENISVFVNAENLLDIRQTSYDPLLRSQRTTDGAWTVDAWGPLEGLMVNAGARIRFGGR